MSEKCVNTGNSIEFCDALANTLKTGLGDFDTQIRTRFSDCAEKLVVTAGRFKKNKVIISYCPACGADIKTHFGESIND